MRTHSHQRKPTAALHGRPRFAATIAVFKRQSLHGESCALASLRLAAATGQTRSLHLFAAFALPHLHQSTPNQLLPLNSPESRHLYIALGGQTVVSAAMAAFRPPPSNLTFNEQLYNHIALPRDVPGREDRNLSSIEGVLLARLTDATRFLSQRVAHADRQHLQALVDSLNACRAVHVDRAITKTALLQELRELKPGRILILHVSAQNCGLLIYKDIR